MAVGSPSLGRAVSLGLDRLVRHWLAVLNVALAAFLAGALAAPALAALGWAAAADALYAAYHLTCHQWAFRSFFLFGPRSVYSQTDLMTQGVDPFRFSGDQALGWKMAFCERDLAIYAGLLAVGLLYARRRRLRPASFVLYSVLIAPMALDGFTQLFGWRESTWELRTATGLLFGLASAWLVLPRLDDAFSRPSGRAAYARAEHELEHRPEPDPERACEPLPPMSPIAPASPRG
jgi:uncharacterized membrane protein